MTAPTDVPAARRIPPGAAVRRGLVALVTAVAVNVVVVVAGRAVGAAWRSRREGPPPRSASAVVTMTVGALVVGIVVLALAGRWGAHGWLLVAWAGLAIAALTAALPLRSDASTPTRSTLAVMHLVVGTSWYLAVRRVLAGEDLAATSR